MYAVMIWLLGFIVSAPLLARQLAKADHINIHDGEDRVMTFMMGCLLGIFWPITFTFLVLHYATMRIVFPQLYREKKIQKLVKEYRHKIEMHHNNAELFQKEGMAGVAEMELDMVQELHKKINKLTYS